MANTTLATSYAAIVKQEKQEDGTLLVYGKATDDAIDSDNQICDATWLSKAMPEWFKSGGNIREQHSNIAAGVAKELDSKSDGHYISALVVDPTSVKKVEAGVLKGFSIGIRGARVQRDDKALGGRIIDGQIVEVSLVDRPANPNAKLMLAKSDGTEVIQVEEMIENQEVVEPTIVEEAPAVEEVVAPELVEEELPVIEEAIEEIKPEESQDIPAEVVEEKSETTEEVKTDKCLECGCNVPNDAHGRTDVSTATMIPAGETPKSPTITMPRIDVDGNDVTDNGDEEEEDSAKADKSALTDDAISVIIEKAVKSAIETVRSEIDTLKSANEADSKVINKLKSELATANSKAASGGPKRTALKPVTSGVNEFINKAAEYRAKAAATSDPILAKGWKEMAADFEIKAKELLTK